MKAERIVILVMALAAGLVAAYLIATRPPVGLGRGAEYFCYELRQGWVCTYARPDCEARLAREAPADVKTHCAAHTVDAPSP